MPAEYKVKAVEGIKEKINNAKCILVVENKGLTVEEMDELRSKLRELGDNDYKVYKNRLFKKAIVDTEIPQEEFGQYLTGPNAFSLAYQDPTAPARILAAFSKKHVKLIIKGGVLDGETLTSDKVQYIATLPSKEELLSKVLGSINAPASGIVACVSGVMRKLVCALSEIKKQKESQAS